MHGARYADYSHGVRLVSVVAYVDGRPRSLIDALQDPRLAPALSDEGPIARAAELMSDGSGSAEEPSEAVAQKASDLTGLVARALSRD